VFLFYFWFNKAMTELLQLFPAPHETRPLQGLYLSRHHHRAGTPEKPFVYANFVTSLDGRIALHDDQLDEAYVPDALTNPNDFRLFLELQAQADCLITHGGYCRDLAAGKLGNILQVGVQPGAEDLPDWRKQQGLSAQPDIVIASASLDFPIPDFINPAQQRLIIATGMQADEQQIQKWQDRGYEVLQAGKKQNVEAAPLIDALSKAGYQSLYLVAGPHMLETMLHQCQLSCLYLTQTHQFLGGDCFHTPIPGMTAGPFGKLQLQSLYYDIPTEQTAGQLFSQFEISYE